MQYNHVTQPMTNQQTRNTLQYYKFINEQYSFYTANTGIRMVKTK